MSMNAYYRALSARAIEALVGSPDLVSAYVYYDSTPDDDPTSKVPAQLRELAASMEPEARDDFVRKVLASIDDTPWMSQMFGNIRASSNKRVAAAGLEAADFGTPLGIAKAWHGLHFILAGTIWDATEPPGNVVFGGAAIGEDIGYGPARFMSPSEVIQTADALSRTAIEKLRESYDPQAFAAAELYAVDLDDPQELDAILDNFTKVKDYFMAAAQNERGMLLYMT